MWAKVLPSRYDLENYGTSNRMPAKTFMASKTSHFLLLALVNLFVGGMVGLERTVVPLLAEGEFGLERGVAVGCLCHVVRDCQSRRQFICGNAR
jgi:hypothetical protein